MISIRKLSSTRALAFGLIAPFALTLAACNGEAEGEDALAGDAIAAVPAPAGTSWSETVNTSEEGGYVLGNPDAPLKLVEYGSLTCPACAAFAKDGMPDLVENYVNTGVVSFEFRSFIIHGPLDLTLTRLIGCSTPEAAIPLADQIWANLPAIQQRAYADQEALQSINNLPENERFVRFGELTGLYEFFAARGISEDQARQCLGDFASLERLAKFSEAYSGDGINRTPTFELNGKVLEAGRWADLEPVLQRAGARPE